MRLIDADILKKQIHCAYSDDLEILEKIDAQPTAYDLAKVVKQLEEKCNNSEKYCLENREKCELYAHCDQCAFKSAIRIVKGGGVDAF